MDPAAEAALRAAVDHAPPLTDAQLRLIADLLGPIDVDGGEAA